VLITHWSPGSVSSSGPLSACIPSKCVHAAWFNALLPRSTAAGPAIVWPCRLQLWRLYLRPPPPVAAPVSQPAGAKAPAGIYNTSFWVQPPKPADETVTGADSPDECQPRTGW
jgi:hypothetical protein